MARIAMSSYTHSSSYAPGSIPPQFKAKEDGHDYNLIHEFEALQQHSGYTDLTLFMQIYEVYDRKIQDQTIKNKPLVEVQILKVEEFIPTQQSLFQ